MDELQRKYLAQAEIHYHGGRIPEAYGILRRFFDRLPFQQTPEHAKYLGYFIRSLLELGKEFELNFYLREIERIHASRPSNETTFMLAVVYLFGAPHQQKKAKPMFASLLNERTPTGVQVRARMFLADALLDEADVAGARAVIDSCPEPSDEHLRRLLAIWHGVILRKEQKFSEAKEVLEGVIGAVSVDEDWYSVFSAKLVLALVCVDLNERERANGLVEELRAIFVGKRFKRVESQLRVLEDRLEEKKWTEPLRILRDGKSTVLSYGARTMKLKQSHTTDKLLLHFVRRRSLDKEGIIRVVYGRRYRELSDDKLVYYHAHSLRKRLRMLGLPRDAVQTLGAVYRLLPEVQFVEEA
jgi:tetratricopeptide (TPR) repeat protein